MIDASHGTLTMDLPAVYRIRVVGRVDPGTSGRIAGMQITKSGDSAGHVETLLIGQLSDQAALSGVLNTLYEMHLPVKSVECLEVENEAEGSL